MDSIILFSSKPKLNEGTHLDLHIVLSFNSRGGNINNDVGFVPVAVPLFLTLLSSLEGILDNRRLNTFNRKPVGCNDIQSKQVKPACSKISRRGWLTGQ